MPRKKPVIALLTDFGTRDHYVGAMKAAMLSICPSAQFVDISHEVGAQNIREAAYLLWASYKFLPHRTTVAAVVDPGVGTSRSIVIARTEHHTFVSPENGLLDFVLWEEDVRDFVVVDRKRLISKQVIGPRISNTFHGRDIIAPLCAHLANGLQSSDLGAVTPVGKKTPPFYSPADQGVLPRILWIDRFGNIVTNISAKSRMSLKGLTIGSRTVSRWVESYAEAPSRSASLIAGSSGLIEIVIKNGNAAASLLRRKNAPLHVISSARRGKD